MKQGENNTHEIVIFKNGKSTSSKVYTADAPTTHKLQCAHNNKGLFAISRLGIINGSNTEKKPALKMSICREATWRYY